MGIGNFVRLRTLSYKSSIVNVLYRFRAIRPDSYLSQKIQKSCEPEHISRIRPDHWYEKTSPRQVGHVVNKSHRCRAVDHTYNSRSVVATYFDLLWIVVDLVYNLFLKLLTKYRLTWRVAWTSSVCGSRASCASNLYILHRFSCLRNGCS